MIIRLLFILAITFCFVQCKTTDTNKSIERKWTTCPQNFLPLDAQKTVSKICFGSCSRQKKPQPILEMIAEQKPDLFIYLGDNMYGDTENMALLASKYELLCTKTEFQTLQKACPIVATWDDHDYGVNDAGMEYPQKETSKEIFLEFWGEPAKSERRKHKGIYTSYMLGPKGQRVQVILLDNRTFRTPLLPASDDPKKYKNDYRPNDDPTANMLGDDQWKWLEKAFEQPADLRIIGSSNQFGITYNGFEAWANMPLQKEKMLNLIKDKNANGVVFISGDVHYAELSKVEHEGLYPIYDCTSSGLTQSWKKVEPNDNRISEACYDNNYGTIEIDWATRQLTFRVTDIENTVRIEHQVSLDDLKN